MVKSHFYQAALIALFGQPASNPRKTLIDHVIDGKIISDKVENVGWANNIYEAPNLAPRQIEDHELVDYEKATLALVRRAIALNRTKYWQASAAEYTLLAHHMWGMHLRHKELFNSKRPESGQQIAASYSSKVDGVPRTMIEVLLDHVRADPLAGSQSPLAKLSIGITDYDVPLCFDAPFYTLSGDDDSVQAMYQPLSRNRLLIADYVGAQQLEARNAPKHLFTRIELVDLTGHWKQAEFYDWMTSSAFKSNRQARDWVVNPGSGRALLDAIDRARSDH